MICKTNQFHLCFLFSIICAEIIPISSDSSIEPSYGHVQPLSWEDYFPKNYDPKDYFPSAKRVESSTTLTLKQEEKMEFATKKEGAWATMSQNL